MKLDNKNTSFGNVELFVFVYCSTVVLGLIFMPYISSEEIRSAWLKVIVGIIPYLLFLILLVKVGKKFNQPDILYTFRQLSYKWIYYPVMVYFLISTVGSIFWGIKSLAIIVQTYLLQNTEQWIIIVTFLAFVWVSVLYGIKGITRLLVLMFIAEIGVIIMIALLYFHNEFRWIYVIPVFSVDTFTFLKSSLSETTRYSGIITLLCFLPLLKKDTNVLATAGSSLFLVMVLYVLVSIVTLGTFGFDQTLELLSPITALIQTAFADVMLFERLDLFFLTIWIWGLYKVALIYIWFATTLVKKIIPVKKNKEWLPVTIIIIISCVVSVITPSYVILPWQPLNINTLIYTLILPITIFIYLLLRKKQNLGE